MTTSAGAWTGRQIGDYDVGGLLGAGGMGEVYRAHDRVLHRDVALKVLPAAFLDDAERARRFEREARVLASLNHPNIAAIYGLERAGAVRALILELVPGETLADLLDRGPVDLPDVLAIARQMADGLDAAHEKGIVHRDLKPANVKRSDNGTVKILDFGLAKATQEDRTAAETETALDATRAGTVLGTAAYMSPEQARGAPVDRRADVWAYGCVLFELLSGRSPFAAATLSDTLATVLTREPDWTALPASTPPGVLRVLRRCLAKDQGARWRDIADVRFELDDAARPGSEERPAVTAAPRRRSSRWTAIVVSLASAAAIAALASDVALRWKSPDVTHAVRLSLQVPGQFVTVPPSAVLSPDGRHVAFVTVDGSGNAMLWLRALDAQEAHPLTGTERADQPFWSANGRSLGFFADGQLKRVDIAGGSVQTLATAPVSPGATWNQQGMILFSSGGQFARISEAGGPVTPAVPSPLKGTNFWPHFLPDGRHFLFHQRGVPEGPGILVGSLDSPETTRLMSSEFEGEYAAPGYLLFVRDESLFAQPFDAAALRLSGEPVLLATGAWAAAGYGHTVFSASVDHTLAYVDAAIADTQLAWFDRGGRRLGVVGPLGRYESPPQLSPSGTTVAIARGPFFRQDIWLFDVVRDVASRFTFDPAGSRVPIWSSEGAHVFFQSPRGDGVPRVYERDSSGAGVDARVADVTSLNVQDVAPDGRSLVLTRLGKTGHFELWILPLTNDRQPVPFLQTAFNCGQAQISPDGHWIAYTSNEAGRDEVYVQSFPVAGSKQQISIEGGAQPRWRPSGGELYYLAADQRLMAVAVTAKANVLQTARPVVLFRTRLEFLGLQGPFFMPGYAVTPDGQKFLLNAPPDDRVAPINLILNWPGVLHE